MDKVVPAANGAFIILACLCCRPAYLLNQQRGVNEVGCDNRGSRHLLHDVVVVLVVVEPIF